VHNNSGVEKYLFREFPLTVNLGRGKDNNNNNNSNNNINNNYFILYCDIMGMDQGEPGLDYNDSNLNPLICDICNKSFDSLEKLGEHQKEEHDM
jgi:C2H2-type zinc finger